MRLIKQKVCWSFGLSLYAFVIFVSHAKAQLHPSEIRSLSPIFGKLGKTTAITIQGVSFRNAKQIVFDRAGITANLLPTKPEEITEANSDSDGVNVLHAEFVVAPNAAPGIYRFRVISESGVSSLGKWLVGRDLPSKDEQEPNNFIPEARLVTIPLTITGAISLAATHH